ncbi:MAG: amidohydrolase family protein [Synergistaceae bacterium]|jgi:predicted amidohydrolase YtcJ|nr:amidohydrolase family protein [Synergistaceae bacterium]
MSVRSGRILLVLSLCFGVLVSTAFGAGADGVTADSVWKNGKIYTVDKKFSVIQAIAVKGGKIIYAGSDADADKFVGKETSVNDLGGKTVIPGLNDAHIHYLSLGTTKLQVNAHWRPKEEILNEVKAAAAKARPGEWVLGRGWNQEVWDPAEFPTKEELDAVAPDVPVSLVRTCGHMTWTNSKALELAGVTKDTQDPTGGEFLRDKNGEPIGVMTDQAQEYINKVIPPITSAQERDALIEAQKELVRFGITSASDAGSNQLTIDILKELYAKDTLKVRLDIMARVTGRPSPEELLLGAEEFFARGIQTGLFDDRLQIRSYKISLDGSLGARSAWMLNEYSDRPGHRGNGKLSDEELYQLVLAGHKAGFQLNSHAIGDAANRQVLDVYQRVLKEYPNFNHRFRVEHAQILTAEDLLRFAELGVLPSMQTVHATSDMNMAEERVGPKRIKFAYAWRKLLNTGTVIPNGTDAPVELLDPWINLMAAVTRRNSSLEPEKGWYPEEKMTREEALRSYTIWPAYASFEETKKGSLENGKAADFIVIDRDFMNCPENEIKDIKVIKTVIAGETVYEMK